jgi:hypothetical protein
VRGVDGPVGVGLCIGRNHAAGEPSPTVELRLTRQTP